MEWRYSVIEEYYVDYLIEEKGICKTKAEAKRYFKEALTYNCVREAIEEQIKFLMSENEN